MEVEGLALGLGPARARWTAADSPQHGHAAERLWHGLSAPAQTQFQRGLVRRRLPWSRLRPPLDVLDADHLGALLKPGPVGAKEVLLGFLVLLVNVAGPVGVVLGRATVGDRNDGSLLRLLRQRAS